MSEEKTTFSQDTLDHICASLNYQHALTKLELARSECEFTGERRSAASIRCRALELEVQHEPLDSLLVGLGLKILSPEYDATRKAMLQAVRYAIHGRLV